MKQSKAVTPKRLQSLQRTWTSNFESAEPFDPELTAEGLIAGCGSLVIKSIKRSVINIQNSMLNVRCSTFKA